MDADLQAVQEAVDAAGLSEDIRQTTQACLGQLPKLYRELCQRCESRYSDEIGRLIHAMLKELAGFPAVAEGVIRRLQAMHERLGIPVPNLKPYLPAKKTRPRKAV
jgi:hypothetical protein